LVAAVVPPPFILAFCYSDSIFGSFYGFFSRLRPPPDFFSESGVPTGRCFVLSPSPSRFFRPYSTISAFVSPFLPPPLCCSYPPMVWNCWTSIWCGFFTSSFQSSLSRTTGEIRPSLFLFLLSPAERGRSRLSSLSFHGEPHPAPSFRTPPPDCLFAPGT